MNQLCGNSSLRSVMYCHRTHPKPAYLVPDRVRSVRRRLPVLIPAACGALAPSTATKGTFVRVVFELRLLFIEIAPRGSLAARSDKRSSCARGSRAHGVGNW